MKTYEGGCHCGAVRFEVQAAQTIERLLECNCSVCTKKGILHLPATDDAFAILSGEDKLSLYQFGSTEAKHWFCRECGIHAFGRPRNDSSRYTVNARCLDAFDAIRTDAELDFFDGQNHPKDAPR